MWLFVLVAVGGLALFWGLPRLWAIVQDSLRRG